MKYSLEKDGITQSLLGAYLMCPKRFSLLTQELSGQTNKNIEFGSYIHELLEQGYKHNYNIDSYEFPKIITQDEAEKMRAMALVLIPKYFTVYKNDFKNKKIVPEFVFDTSLNNARVRGKIDCIFNDKVLLETKTKSMISEDNIGARLNIDWQTLFYLMAYRLQTGILLEKVLYNVIRVPQKTVKGSLGEYTTELQKDVDTRPEYYFMRWEVSFSKKDIDDFQQELTEHINRLWIDKHFLRNLCACEAPWPCSFIALCSIGDKSGLIKKKLFSELI